jgi:hypothetical protein
VPELPEHFSLVSSQLSATHDHRRHDSLAGDLKLNGMNPVPIKGNYGYDEHAYLVPHRGTERDRRTVEMLGWKHGQDSVLHSSNDKHKLVFRQKHGQDPRPDWTGEGGVAGEGIKSHYTTLPSGKKFQLLVKPPKDHIEKADAKWAMPLDTLTKSAAEKLDEIRGHLTTLTKKDLADGMACPDTQCDACERAVEQCVCYTGLSKPMLKSADGKLRIRFGNDWSAEDRENYLEDLKNRAGRMLLRKTVDDAVEARERLRKLLGT